jgi:DNA topoisomerase-1
MTKLLIVESPAKCKKIQGYLGAGWRVQATMGHIRALKEDLEAIGFKKGQRVQAWAPAYEAIATKRDAISSLKKAATSPGTEVYLGADDDREGEAIAWHTCIALGLDPATTKRVVFHEITEAALKAAVASPTRIDMNKFEAQQARTMLDMLIGFTLSPCLWRGVGYKPGLSAGRCQTPALRIIYERDREIEGHTATLSWRIQALSALPTPLQWKCPAVFESEETATAALKAILDSKVKVLTITDRQERVSTSQAPHPLITSSLQQEAANRLGMNPKVTMRLAQTLYEAGHITYMRTDNAVLSQEAVEAASALVTAKWGESYLGSASADDKPVKKIVKKKVAKATEVKETMTQAQAAHEVSAKADTSTCILTSQNAHEAIRPTHFENTELADMGPQEQRLYTLIWKRAVQSVMATESRDCVKLTAAIPSITIETTWDQTRFAGWRILEQNAETEKEEKALYEVRKPLVQGATVPWSTITASEVRTAPPPRYTEASLIRDLETKGIGRPSTYATLVETVLDRGYIEKTTIAAQPIVVKGLELKAGEKALKATTKTEKTGGEKDKLHTTPLGRTVIEWLLTKFDDILEYGFTAHMETLLDEVAKGTRAWPSVLEDTWSRYAERYEEVLAAPSESSGSRSNSSDFGDGYKMVVSKKGPLFVYEQEGQKTRFATVPATLSLQTATRADAEAAFTAVAADQIGDLEGSPVTRKKGPYGYYAAWKEHKVNCKETETLEEISPRLLAKTAVDSVNHTVGPYTIRRGPYGLYMFKVVAGSKKKPTFVSLPESTEWSTLTPESAEQIYTQFSKAKKTK